MTLRVYGHVYDDALASAGRTSYPAACPTPVPRRP